MGCSPLGASLPVRPALLTADVLVQVCRLRSGRLGSLRPRESQWTGACDRRQLAVQVALAVAKPRRESCDPLTIDHPSAINCIARPTRSPRLSHSGEPGDASGLQRLQARKPASCAAAAVGKRRTFSRLGVRDGQLGRQ
jgi:hypothetical protein